MCHADKGGDGGHSGGCTGPAGSEQSPSEVKGGISRQVFGAGPTEEGRSSTEGTGEGRLSHSLPSALPIGRFDGNLISSHCSAYTDTAEWNSHNNKSEC